MIIEQNSVELLSIKLKSKQDIDNETVRNATVHHKSTQPLAVVSPKRSSILGASCHVLNGNDNDDTDADADDVEHSESSVRLLALEKTANGICGFHLTRTKWDPYPWISAVDKFTPAEKSGLQAGDCVLEVNGCDVLGLRITEIAKIIESSKNQVTLLLWSTKCNSSCDEESLCAAAMPRSLQRLSAIVQYVLSVIECPVCLDTITPPAMQCQNGHLLCVNCRIRAENCPVCRDRYYPRPALIAEQLQAAITSAFDLCRNEDKVRQKIFGRLNRQQQMVRSSLECLTRTGQVHKSSMDRPTITQPDSDICPKAAQTIASTANNRCVEGIRRHKASGERGVKRNKSTTGCNKLLTKLLNFNSSSMVGLTDANSTSKASSSNGIVCITYSTIPPDIGKPSLSHATLANDIDAQSDTHQREEEHRQQHISEQKERDAANHLNNDCNETNVVRPKQLLSATATATAVAATKPIVNNDKSINSNPFCCKQTSSNRIEHFSLSSSDLTERNTAAAAIMSPANVHCIMESVSSTVTASSLSLPTSTMRYNSPVWFRKRPCIGFGKNQQPSIPRALKLSANSLLKSQMLQTNAYLENSNPLDFACDKNSMKMSDEGSTHSTASLKSLASFN